MITKYGIPISIGDVVLYLSYSNGEYIGKVTKFTKQRVGIQINGFCNVKLFSEAFEGDTSLVSPTNLVVIIPLIDHYKTNHQEILL